MQTIDIACRECAQQPGEPCAGLSNEFHAKRVEDALAWGEFNGKSGQAPTVEQFDKAVTDILF